MTAFYVLATVIFLTFLGGGITVPLLPIYAGSLGASLVQIAWIAGGYSTVSLIANLGWGRICDRLGRRKPFLVASMAVLTATSFLASLVGVWWLLLPLRLVEGGAFGAYGVASLAMLGDILDGNPHRPRLVAASRMSGSLAFSVAVVAAGLFSQSYGLPATYRAASGAYILAFVVCLFLPESHRAPGPIPGQTRASFVELLRGPMLPLLAVAASFNIPFSAVYYAVWPIWVTAGLGLGQATFTQLWGLASFVEVPCLALAGYLTDRLGRRFTFTLGMAFFAGVYGLYLGIAAFGGILADPAAAGSAGVGSSVLPALILAQVLRGFAFAAFTATALTMAIEVSPPNARGRAAGLYQMAESLSNVAGSYAGGPIAQALGYPVLFASAAGAVLLGAGYVRFAVARPAGRSAARTANGSGFR